MTNVENFRWNPTVHATRRLKERCNIEPDQAKNFVNQLMQTAKYVSTQGKCAIYHHIGRDLFIVADTEKDNIVTLYPSEDYEAKQGAKTIGISADSPLFATVVATVKRELAKARRKFNRESKALQVAIADATIELAKAQRNFVRAKAPHVKTIIRQRIEDYTRNIDEMTAELERKKGEFERTQADGKAMIAE